MSPRIRRRVLQLLQLLPVGAVLSLTYFAVQQLIDDDPIDLTDLPGIAANGVIITALAGFFELIFLPSRPGAVIRRQTFTVQLMIRLIVMWIAILAGLTIGNLVFNPDIPAEYWRGPAIAIDAVVTFVLAMLVLLILQMRDLAGPGVLGAFILGRYFRPVREFRVFLFLDLANSTPLAQRLGDEGTHAFISQFFFDIAPSILEHRGETHRYIGDEIVVTWRESTAFKNNNCLRAVFAIDAEIAQQRAQYESRFGIVPEFRAALHCGMVAAGECGEDKREIVFFGDTINTTARMQGLCKVLARRIIISDNLRERLVDNRFAIEPLGDHELRGRDAPITLFSVEEFSQPTTH